MRLREGADPLTQAARGRLPDNADPYQLAVSPEGSAEAELLVEHGLSLPAFEVLAHLHEAPDRRLRMNDLADRVLLSRSGLTRLADRLQNEGLLRREACPSDARGLYAVLTDEGAARRDAAAPTYQRAIRGHFLDLLDDDELRKCTAVLTKLLTRGGACPPDRRRS